MQAMRSPYSLNDASCWRFSGYVADVVYHNMHSGQGAKASRKTLWYSRYGLYSCV